jgi:hypothetical protein
LEVLNARHEARASLADEVSSVQTDGVAVLGIEVARNSTTTFITEVVALRFEFRSDTFVSFFQFGFKHQNEEFFSINLSHLDISMGISVK